MYAFHQYETCLEWCVDNDRGAYACMSQLVEKQPDEFNLVTLAGLRGRLAKRKGKGVSNGYEYSDRRILCKVEEIQLAKWLRDEARAGRPRSRAEARKKVVDILELRASTRWAGRCP